MFYDQIDSTSVKKTDKPSGKGGFTKKFNSTPQLYKSQTGVISFANGQYSISSGN